MTRTGRAALGGVLWVGGALALAGCDGKQATPPPPEATDTGSIAAAASGVAVESDYGTPVKDRVATLGFLNKRNNITQDVALKSGESRRFGNVIIKLATCEKTAPWETPQETGAFVQVFVEEALSSDRAPTWRKVFSGWMFRNSPSLNVVEHPVYDVWVKDCAMNFPGEEESLASARSAAKPTGNASGAVLPSPAASPSPTASASARAAAISPSE